MSGRPFAVLALTPVAEQAIEALLFGGAALVEARASVAEADELEREAATTPAELVLLSPALSGITPAHCTRVRSHGLRLVGLALDQREHEALTTLGVDAIVTPETIGQLLTDRPEIRLPESVPLAREPANSVRVEPDGGSVLAVVGSKGAPGSSECAGSLAALASERWPCVLVELDALGGALDIRLGADPNQGSLLGLLRAGDTQDGVLLLELLERWLTTAEGWPPVLLGPPDLATALPELARPGATQRALRSLAAVYPLCVTDVGYLLGGPDEVPLAAKAHREALVSADAVLLVLGAREQQLRAGLNQLDLLLDELEIKPERLRIVVNGIGAPGAGRFAEIEPTLIERLAQRRLTIDARLPWDERALKRGSNQHGPLAIAHRRGHYARTLAALLDELFLPTAPTPRSRKQRLPAPKAAVPMVAEEVALPWRQ